MLRRNSIDHHKAVPVSHSIVVESKAGTCSRTDKPDVMACPFRHTKGNTIEIALVIVEVNGEGKAAAYTKPNSTGTSNGSSIQVPHVGVDVVPEKL